MSNPIINMRTTCTPIHPSNISFYWWTNVIDSEFFIVLVDINESLCTLNHNKGNFFCNIITYSVLSSDCSWSSRQQNILLQRSHNSKIMKTSISNMMPQMSTSHLVFWLFRVPNEIIALKKLFLPCTILLVVKNNDFIFSINQCLFLLYDLSLFFAN